MTAVARENGLPDPYETVEVNGVDDPYAEDQFFESISEPGSAVSRRSSKQVVREEDIPLLEINDFTPEERIHFQEVLQRYFLLYKNEGERQQQLKKDLDSSAMREVEDNNNGRVCHCCGESLNFLLNPGKECSQCASQTCSKCLKNFRNGYTKICVLCYLEDMHEGRSGKWFMKNLQESGRRPIFGTDVLRASLRRHKEEEERLLRLEEDERLRREAEEAALAASAAESNSQRSQRSAKSDARMNVNAAIMSQAAAKKWKFGKKNKKGSGVDTPDLESASVSVSESPQLFQQSVQSSQSDQASVQSEPSRRSSVLSLKSDQQSVQSMKSDQGLDLASQSRQPSVQSMKSDPQSVQSVKSDQLSEQSSKSGKQSKLSSISGKLSIVSFMSGKLSKHSSKSGEQSVQPSISGQTSTVSLPAELFAESAESRRHSMQSLQSDELSVHSSNSAQLSVQSSQLDQQTVQSSLSGQQTVQSLQSDQQSVQSMKSDQGLDLASQSRRPSVQSMKSDPQSVQSVKSDQRSEQSSKSGKQSKLSSISGKLSIVSFMSGKLSKHSSKSGEQSVQPSISGRTSTVSLPAELFAESADSGRHSMQSLQSDELSVHSSNSAQLSVQSVQLDQQIAESLLLGQQTVQSLQSDQLSVHSSHSGRLSAQSTQSDQQTIQPSLSRQQTVQSLQSDQLSIHSSHSGRLSAQSSQSGQPSARSLHSDQLSVHSSHSGRLSMQSAQSGQQTVQYLQLDRLSPVSSQTYQETVQTSSLVQQSTQPVAAARSPVDDNSSHVSANGSYPHDVIHEERAIDVVGDDEFEPSILDSDRISSMSHAVPPPSGIEEGTTITHSSIPSRHESQVPTIIVEGSQEDEDSWRDQPYVNEEDHIFPEDDPEADMLGLRAPSHTGSNRSGTLGSYRSSAMMSQESIMSIYSDTSAGYRLAVDVTGEIMVALDYDFRHNIFFVKIKQARDIAAVDTKRKKSDPYVKTYLLPDKTKISKRKTSYRKNTLCPQFDEQLKYVISKSDLETRVLSVAVWHRVAFGHNIFLGEAHIQMENYEFGDATALWYPLHEKKDIAIPMPLMMYKGDLILAVKYIPGADIMSVSSGKDGETRGEVHAWIKEAKNLVAARPNGYSDPFCKGYLLPDKGKQGKKKTRVIRRNLNPAWNTVLRFTDVDEEDLGDRCLELTIWDYGRFSSNEFLGGLRLNLGIGVCRGQRVKWMDSKGHEITMWQAMISRPSTWIEGTLMLRPNMD